MFLKQDRLIL